MLEVWSHRQNLVDQILHTYNAEFAQIVFNQLIVGKSDTLLVDLSVATLVDELANRLQVRIAVCDVGIDNGQHFRGCFCESDEDAIVDLKESEQLKDLTWLRGDFIDTVLVQMTCTASNCPIGSPFDSDDENQLRLCLNVE